jgi:ParB/RepB/Spo0J family partition protein
LVESSQATVLKTVDIYPNPDLAFEERDHSSLEGSVQRHGILEPILVRRHPGKAGKYEIICGESRWRSAKKNHIKRVSATIRVCDDRTAILLSAIENFTRCNLSATQEAELFAKLVTSKYSKHTIAMELGISRAQVGERLKLYDAMAKNPELRKKIDKGLVAASAVEFVYSQIKNEKVRNDLVGTVVAKELSLDSTIRFVKGSQPSAEAHDRVDQYNKQEEGNAEASHKPSEHEEEEPHQATQSETIKAESRHQKPQTLTLTLIDIARGLVLQDGKVRDTRTGRVYDLVELLRNLLASKVHAGDLLQVMVKQTIRPTETVRQAVHA